MPEMAAATTASDWTADPRRWGIFALLLVGAFLPPLNFSIVILAIPSIAADLGADPAAIQFVVSAYVGVYAVSLVTGGRLGDLYGRNRMFVTGLLGFAFASALCGLAWSPMVLIVGRILQGLAAAVMAPQGLAAIQALFPEDEKPRALGFYGAVFGLATLAGQVMGGFLVALDAFGLGWRLPFLMNLPVIAGVLLLSLRYLRETRLPSKRKLDLGGVFLSVVALACLIVPLVEGRQAGWPGWAVGMLLTAPVAALVFWRYERRLACGGGDPLVDPRALRAPGLWPGLGAALFFYSIAVFFVLLSVYLQTALGQTAFQASLVFLPFGLGFLIGPGRAAGGRTTWRLADAGRHGDGGAGLSCPVRPGRRNAGRNRAVPGPAGAGPLRDRVRPGIGPAGPGALDRRARSPAIRGPDRRCPQLGAANQRGPQRRGHRQPFLFRPRRPGRTGPHRGSFCRGDAVHRRLPDRRGRLGSDSAAAGGTPNAGRFISLQG